MGTLVVQIKMIILNDKFIKILIIVVSTFLSLKKVTKEKSHTNYTFRIKRKHTFNVVYYDNTIPKCIISTKCFFENKFTFSY